MLPVSQKWRDAITEHRTKSIRGQMKATVYIGAFDESASGDATLTHNAGQMYYSDFNNVNSSDGQECSYATWEQDSFRGDGVQYLVPPSGGSYLRQGWISNTISKSDGTFSTNPYITITFSEPHSMVGLTMLFDPYFVADSFTIKQYNNGTQIDSDSFSGNTDSMWTNALNIVDADKITITFTKALPYQRIHLQYILFGIGYTYDNSQLIDFSFVRANNPLSLSLPQNSLTFSLFNENGKFNVDKSDSLIRFLKDDQRVVATMWFDTTPVSDDLVGTRVYYDENTGNLMLDSNQYYDGSQLTIQNGNLVQMGLGYTLYIIEGWLYADETPTWEQLKLCTLWLKSWDVKGSVATFKCNDAFERLNNIEYRDSAFGNTALSTRLDTLMSYAGYSDYEFSMTNQQCKVFPPNTVAQLLQLSANLTMSTLEQDPDAKVIIRPRIEPTISSVTALGTTEAWSVPASIGRTDNTTYSTFEINFFTGDGSQTLMGTPYLNNGITWSEYPIGGVYSNAVCRIELTDNSTFGSLDVVFPSSYSPSTYTITGYRYSSGTYTSVYTRTVDGNTRSIADTFDRIKRIDIRIDGCYLNQRARLKTVILGWATGYDIVAEDIIDRPTGKILTACRDAIADVRTYTAESDQLASADCTANVETDISWNDPATSISATASTGTVTIVSSYAYHAVVKTSANAKVTITGNRQNANITQETESVNLHGEDLEVDNPLLSSVPADYMTWMKDYAAKDTEFQAETLGFPELEAADLIDYKGEPAQIIKHTLTFNSGACRSQFILRKE